MPQLVILGRRWHIAADDLPLPSLLGALWHIAILVLNSVELSYVVQQIDTSCPYRKRHIAYLTSHLFCFFVNSILHTWTFFESIRGSMFQVHRRRRVAPLVLAVVIFYMLTIANNVFGTRLIYTLRSSQCNALPGRLHLDHVALMEALVVVTWISLFVGCLAMVITLNLFSTYQAASSPWLSRFKLYRLLCCCCLGACGEPNGEEESSKEAEEEETSSGRIMSPMVVIANVFTHMFGRVDMTLTDYIAALTLLGLKHSHSKPALTYGNAPPPTWLVEGNGSGPRDTAVSGGDHDDGDDDGGGGGRQIPTGFDNVILQPPPVVELLARTDDGVGTGGGGGPGGLRDQSPGAPSPKAIKAVDATPTARAAVPAVAAKQIVLNFNAATAPSPHPPFNATAAANSTTTSNALAIATTAISTIASANSANKPSRACEGPRPISISITTSQPDMTATNVEIDGTRSLTASAATGGKAHRAISAGEPPLDVEAGGLQPPGALPSPTEGHGRGFPLRPWDSHDFAHPNPNMEVMQEALHYMRFATAVYGWKMYLWMNLLHVTNCCRLCLGRSCGCCRQSSYFLRSVGPDYGPPEGCCSAAKLLEREAITQLTDVPDDDILYVCYDNQVEGLLPYYVALDRERRSVVVGIRGSLSLRDVVTDLLCEPTGYDVPGVPSTDASGRRVLWAHRGMVKSTNAIFKDIQREGVLEAAIATWSTDEAAQQRLMQQLPSERARAVARRLKGTCSGFRIVLTGHSLGAGVTGLLGPLLQKQFPNLRCWAFSPPGGLMSPKAAELTHGICISVLHAKDMIPRLGVCTMEQLVQELVNVGVYSRVNKMTIMGRLILMGVRPPLEQIFLPANTTVKPELRSVLEKCSSMEGPSVKVAHQFTGARDFVPPGHMLYVERRKPAKEEPSCCCCNVCMLDRSARNARYICRWIQIQDVMKAGLVISRSMFLDHLPDNTLYALETAVKQMSGEDTRSGSGAVALVAGS